MRTCYEQKVDRQDKKQTKRKQNQNKVIGLCIDFYCIKPQAPGEEQILNSEVNLLDVEKIY